MSNLDLKIEQIAPAQPGWYAVYHDTHEEWFTPILCLGLANGEIHMMSTDHRGSICPASALENFSGLVYAPQLIYKERLLWTTEGELIDPSVFMP